MSSSRRVIEDLKLAKDKVYGSLGSGKAVDARVDRSLKVPTDVEFEVELIPIDAVEDESNPLEAPYLLARPASTGPL